MPKVASVMYKTYGRTKQNATYMFTRKPMNFNCEIEYLIQCGWRGVKANRTPYTHFIFVQPGI